MRIKKPLSILPLIQIILSLVVLAWLIRLQIDVNVALRKIELARIVCPGKMRQDVILHLGNPDLYEKDIFRDQKGSYSLMTYKEDIYRTTRLNGYETIYILLDQNEKIIVTYFNSLPNRIMLERGTKTSNLTN